MKRGPWLLLLCALLPLPARAAVLHVEADGSGQYATIQAALTAAQPGDIVELGNGVYSGPGNRDLNFGNFTGLLRSASGAPALCELALGGFPIGRNNFGHGFELEGICFSGGSKLTLTFSDVELRNCWFVNNVGALSDSYYLDFGPTVNCTDCEFRQCSDTIVSSGVLILQRCRFEGNTGMAARAQQLLSFDTRLIDNQVDGPLVTVWGADTYFGEGTLVGCSFIANSVESCVYASYNLTVTLADCAFFGNTGAGLHLAGSAVEMQGCTFVANAGPAADVVFDAYSEDYPRTIDIESSLFAYRQGGTQLAVVELAPILSVSCCDIFGNAGGDWTGELAPFAGLNGNLSLSPKFCDLAAGDLTLFDSSPCLPANNSCGVQIGAEGQGCTDPTAVEPAPAGALRLSAAPNPFNPKTRLSFTLPQAARVSLAVFDASGRRVATLLDNAERPAGAQAVDWDARGLASGVYLARLVAGELRQETKLTLLR